MRLPHLTRRKGRDRAMRAADSLVAAWRVGPRERQSLPAHHRLHQGPFNAFRSSLNGESVNIASAVQQAENAASALGESAVFVTDAVRDAVTALRWHNRLVPVAVKFLRPRHEGTAVYRLTGSPAPAPIRRDPREANPNVDLIVGAGAA
jgi:hypothetical protein